MKALLADDHGLFRHGFEMLLKMRLGFDEVIQAETGAQTIELFESESDIDLVLLDYHLGRDNGLSVLASIKARCPETHVVMISGQETAETIVRSLGEGAAGFVPKHLSPQQLAEAITRIMGGEIYVPSLGKAQEAGKVKTALEEAESQRMSELAEVARRVIRDKDLSYRLDADGNEVTSAFNSLLAELQEEKFKLEAMAFTDVLTGAANRRLFLSHAEAALRSTKRRGTTMALAYIDLDDFKELNDTLGHEAGDKVLAEIAARLRNGVREVDTVARIGGDEFTMILQDVGDRAYVERLVNRLFGKITEEVELEDGKTWHPSCSIGVVLADGIENLKELMARADKAMYSVKQSGKNHYLIKDLFD